MELKTVPLSALKLNADINARNGDKPDVGDMVASIAAKGLGQPLAVRIAGNAYEIIDGKRRFVALNALVAAGTIDSEYGVPVLIRTDDDASARELSLAANVIRQDLTPYEEAVAFAKLQDDGQTPEHIAAHFGMSLRRVEQRMAIARLPAPILEAFHAGKLTVEAAQAFTLSRDEKQQLKVFKDLATNPQPWMIKSRLVDKSIKAETSPEANYVGIEAYVAAGGTVRSDLFSEDVYIDNSKILAKVFEEKLSAEEKRLKEEGWSFVIISRDPNDYRHNGWSRLEPKGDVPRLKEIEKEVTALEKERRQIEGAEDDAYDETRFDEIEIALDALDRERDRLAPAAYTEKQRAVSGVVIRKTHNDVETSYGLVKPQDKKKVRAAEAAEAKTSKQKAKSSPGRTVGKDDHEEADLTGALLSDLSLQMAGALQLAVAAKPAAAYQCLVAALIHEAISYTSGPISIKGDDFRPAGKVPAHDAFDKLRKEALAPFTKSKGNAYAKGSAIPYVEILTKLDTMKPEAIGKLVAILIASKVHITGAGWHQDEDVRALIDRADPDVGAHFKAGKEFFERLNRKQLAEAIADVDGEDGFAMAVRKKPELVAYAVKTLGPHGWLPKVMRAPCYAGPGSKGWKVPAIAPLAKKAAAKKPAKKGR